MINTINTKFWTGKRVLVTGHTGFKGTWLTFWLTQLGAKVSGIALDPNTTPSAFEALRISETCHHQTIDIRERERLTAAIQEIDPEIVLHLAAQPLVRESYANPIETYDTNVLGTGSLLLALTKCPATKSVVVVTTDKCYENREWEWGYRETDTLGGYDPYSSSKACTEILTASFRRSYFSGKSGSIGIATARAGNVIGGGDWSADRLIPDAVRSYTSNQALEIRNPGSIRPWQHVLVPLSGYLLLAEKLFHQPKDFSTSFNFAPTDDDCVPVKSILEMFGHEWGKPVNWFQSPGEHPHEAHFLKLDSSKAKAGLSWRPRWNLQQALSATALWYRTYLETPGRIADLTHQQIELFTSSL